MKFQIGQKLIAVTFRHHSGVETIDEIEITKIGSKWLYAGRSRVSRESLAIDGAGYRSPGRCYLSREHHRQSVIADTLWLHLRQRIQPKRPSEVMPDDVLAAMKLLKIEAPREALP